MKKILSLALTALMVSVLWNGAEARYNLGSRIPYDRLMVGDTIAIQGISDANNNGYRFLAMTDAKIRAVLEVWFAIFVVRKISKNSRDILETFSRRSSK